MIQKSSFISKEDYLGYYRGLSNDKFPLVKERIMALCAELESLVHIVNPHNFFEIHAMIMGLDAKLQILSYFMLRSNNSMDLRETEILELEQDYKGYFKEICGCSLKDEVPLSLHFSIL